MPPEFPIDTESFESSSTDDSVAEEEAVVIVTPYSTGCCVARDIKALGYKLIRLWNDGFSDNMKEHVPLSCEGLTYYTTVNEKETLDETIEAVKEAAGLCY